MDAVSHQLHIHSRANEENAPNVARGLATLDRHIVKHVPVALSEGVLEVGIVDPDNIEALDALNFISSKINLPFKVFLISEADFKKVLEMYKGLSQEVSRALGELEIEMAADAERTAN